MTKVKIAVVQFKLESTTEKNFKKAEKFIQKASLKKANIIIFPENFISTSGKKKEIFIDSDKKFLKFFQGMAKKYKIDVVPGSVIERNWFGKKYNVSYYIDSYG
ncbi:MAG: nitrilase-related carbon-nitrogen hydrolase, partial [Nanoarchaeota archaeon]